MEGKNNPLNSKISAIIWNANAMLHFDFRVNPSGTVILGGLVIKLTV